MTCANGHPIVNGTKTVCNVVGCEETRPMNVLDQICAYEAGEQTEEEYFAMFAGLVKTGMAWQLQGSYGRTAARLIEDGYISEDGEVLA